MLTLAEQHELAARIKAGDQVAREALIVANFRLVVNIAKRYYSYGATLDDLIQEGCRGLIRAVDRYNPETHNTRFSTYATYWIRNTIQRAIAVNVSLIRVPDYMYRLNVLVHKVGDDPHNQREAAPEDREAAAVDFRSEISRRQGQFLEQSMMLRSSYCRIDDYGEGTSLEGTFEDLHRSEHDPKIAEAINELAQVLDQLTPVEAWLIRRRFGLDDPHEDSHSTASLTGLAAMTAVGSRPWTYTRLARALRISIPRVRQIEQVALEKLRGCLECGVT